LAQKCHGDKPPESRIGLSFGAFRSRLIFPSGNVEIEEWAIGAAFERKATKKITIQVSAGGIGYARVGGPTTPLLRGFFLGFGASWAIVEQKRFIPFVIIGISVAASLAIPEWGGDDGLYSSDFRGSVTAGYTLGDRFSPYLVARAFGGPMFRVQQGRAEPGTDGYHFQLGFGFVVGLPGGFDLSAELVPLGEQRVSAGIGHSF
jgi:hypothetical protein